MTLPAARCAFDGCQAGGAILKGAPRVETVGGPVFHHGCHAARRYIGWNRWPTDEPVGDAVAAALGDLAPLDPESWEGRVEAAMADDLSGRPCSCVDGHGLRCLGVAGPDGLCSACRNHEAPAPLEVFS